MLFEEFVEKHGVDLLVTHCVRLALPIAGDQGGIYFCHFLSNESILRDALGIDLFFVTTAYRSKRQNGFARCAHRLDLIFESRRGGQSAQAAARSLKKRIASSGCCSADSPDKAVSNICIADADGVALARDTHHIVADIDVVIAGGKIMASKNAQGRVLAASGVVIQSKATQSRVVATSGVTKESIITGGCIVVTFRVAKESEHSIGRVVATDGVAKKRCGASSRVEV